MLAFRLPIPYTVYTSKVAILLEARRKRVYSNENKAPEPSNQRERQQTIGRFQSQRKCRTIFYEGGPMGEVEGISTARKTIND